MSEWIDKLFSLGPSDLDMFLKSEVDKLLESVTDQSTKDRLLGLQWRCDMLRKHKYKNNKMGLVIDLHRQMMDSLVELNKELEKLKYERNRKSLL